MHAWKMFLVECSELCQPSKVVGVVEYHIPKYNILNILKVILRAITDGQLMCVVKL